MTLTALSWATQAISIAALLAVWHCRGRTAVALVLACAIAILILHGYFFWDHTTDDAFISFRYSHNLAHGNGLVWNPGERVEGYSNFLWVLLLAGTEFVGLGIVEPSRWLGFAASCGTLAVMYALARELTSDRREAELTFAVAALLLVATAPFSLWTFAGLEEPLFGFLVALALCLHINEERRRMRYPWSAVVAFAAALTRPEGLIVAGVIAVLKTTPLHTSGERRVRSKHLIMWAAALAIPYGLFLGWRVSYYGHLLPNTYYQKLDGAGLLEWQRYRDGYAYVRRFWEQYGLLLLFPMPFLALLRRTSQAAAAPMLAFGTIWTAYVVYIGGDFFAFFRFLVPVLPFAYLLSVHAVISGINRVLVPDARRHVSVVLAMTLLATLAWLMHVPRAEVDNISWWEGVAFENQDIADWIRTQDPQTVVAIYPAGQIPYWSRAPSIDMLGLTDEHIAHQPPYTFRPIIPGHRKGDARYVLDRRPDIMIVGGAMSLFPQSTLSWTTRPKTLLPADNDLFEQPDLWALYEPAWVKLPRGVFNFLRLRDSPRVQAERPPGAWPFEVDKVRAQDLPGSCDNWVLPRPQYRADDGYFYLTAWGAVDGTPRRAVTQYRTDVPGSPDKVVEHYEEYMQLSHWLFTGTEHGEPESGAGDDFTIARFRAGNEAGARTAFVAISDDGKRLVTSTDFISPAEKQSSLYRCVID